MRNFLSKKKDPEKPLKRGVIRSATFVPPELALSRLEFGSPQNPLAPDLLDTYQRYVRTQGEERQALQQSVLDEILTRAKRVVSHPARPTRTTVEEYERYPNLELDLESSLEEEAFFDRIETLRVERTTEKECSCVAALDTSASMAGEKHLLGCVAVAVLLLEMPQSALITFSSNARRIRKLGERAHLYETLRKFLNEMPRGFTNIASALEMMHDEQKHSKRKVGLLATDGRSTEGGDTEEFAKKFDYLIVLHLAGPGSDFEASLKLAESGGGRCLEVQTMEMLPRKLYEATRELIRRGINN